MSENISLIPSRLKNAAVGGHVAGASDIIDDNKGKTQDVINQEADAKFSQMDDEIEALEKQDVVPVDSLPSVSEADPKKIYRVVGETSYTDYMVNATGDRWKELATFDFPGIDDEPTAESNNLVKSGGVFDFCQNNITSLKVNVGYWHNLSEGQRVHDNSFSGTALFRVYENRTYRFFGNVSAKVGHAFYDSDKNFVNGVYNNVLEITIPSGTGICYIALDFEYSASYTSIGVVDITDFRDDRNDIDTLKIDTDNFGLFAVKQLKTANGTPAWYNVFSTLNLNSYNVNNTVWGSVVYRVAPGAVYKLLTDMTLYHDRVIAFWDKNKQILSSSIGAEKLTESEGVFVVPDNAFYMVLTFDSSNPWSYASLVGYQKGVEVSLIENNLEVGEKDIYVADFYRDALVLNQWYNKTGFSIIPKKKYYFSIVGTFANATLGIYFIKNGGPDSYTNIKENYTGSLDDVFELSTTTEGCNGLGLRLTSGTGENVFFSVYYIKFELSRIEKIDTFNKIFCFGDSITQSVEASSSDKRYPEQLQSLLATAGKNIQVYNCGVSGAPLANIGGRQGGIPVILNKDIEFSAGVISVDISDETTFKSSYLNRTAYILNEQGFPHISPCYIDGHKCHLEIRNVNNTPTMNIALLDVKAADNIAVMLHTGSQMRFIGGSESQNGIVIIMGGTNGQYTDADDYVKQCKLMADSVANGRYLVLSQFDTHFEYDGNYSTYATAMAAKLRDLEAIEDACLAAFGNKFVNMRQQLVNNGIRYAIEGGFLTNSAYSSANNIDALSKGYCPFGDDRTVGDHSYNNGLLYNVHPNDAGNYAIARIVYEVIVGLGYVK